MTTLLIIAGLWVGSAVLVIPYLLHVGKEQSRQAALKPSPPDLRIDPESIPEVSVENAASPLGQPFVAPPGGQPALQLSKPAKVLTDA